MLQNLKPEIKTFVIVALIAVAISVAGIFAWQFWQLQETPSISCGGDFSYNVQCPLGTYCKPLRQGPLAGGTCQPYLVSFFHMFSFGKSQGESSPPLAPAPSPQPQAINNQQAGETVLDRKSVWFSETLQGEVVLSSTDAAIDFTRPEELSCLYQEPGKKRYRGNFILSFQEHALPLGDLEFVEGSQFSGELVVKKFDPINTQDFIVLTQYGSCNGNLKSVVGYSFKDSKLKVFPFIGKDGSSPEWLFGSIDYVNGEVINRFYDNGDGKIHIVFYSRDQITETFRFLREQTQDL